MCTEAYVTRLGEIQAVKRLSGNTGRARDDLASPRSKASRAAACFQTSVFVSPRFLVPKRAALVALAFSTLDEIAVFLCFREILKLIIRFEALSLSSVFGIKINEGRKIIMTFVSWSLVKFYGRVIFVTIR